MLFPMVEYVISYWANEKFIACRFSETYYAMPIYHLVHFIACDIYWLSGIFISAINWYSIWEFVHRANRKLETCFLTGGNQIRKDKSSFHIAYWPTIQSTWYTTTSLTINSYIHCQNISFYIVHWYKYNVWKMQNPTRKLCCAPGLSVLHFQLFNFLSLFYYGTQ